MKENPGTDKKIFDRLNTYVSSTQSEKISDESWKQTALSASEKNFIERLRRVVSRSRRQKTEDMMRD